MNPEEPTRHDSFTRWLVAYDERLRGESGEETEGDELDPAMQDRVESAKHCVDLLYRLSRHQGSSGNGVSAETEEAPPLPRQIGRFLIDREVGRGGLGVVYLAFDPQLRRPVAIKVPRPDALPDSDARRRFEREGEAAAKLNHPNILPVFEVGRFDGRSYMVSEYCAGPNLAQWLSAHEGGVTPQEAAQLVLSLAEAVQHAHASGVLHRDIKPSNVMLEPGQGDEAARPSVPRLTDFGAAKLLDGQGDETRTGAIIGTPAYMAPEQADSRLGRVDVRTDVYALGAILYELLAGKAPFVGVSDIDTLRQLITDDPAPPRRVQRLTPRDLEAICLKCLARSPARRYPTAQSLADDLQRFLDGEPTEARPLSALGTIARWSRRRPWAAAMAAASLAFVAILLGGALTYDLRLRREVVRANAAQERAEALLYSSDVGRAYEALKVNNAARALELLERQAPRPGAPDPREFAWRLLKQRCAPESMTLRGHTGAIHGVAYAPDGGSIVTVAADGAARIWDATTGQTRRVLPVSSKELTCVAYSQTGSDLATGGDDGVVRVWDAASGRLLRELRGHAGAVMKVAYSQQGAWLVSSGLDGEIRVWDPQSGDLLKSLRDGTDVVQAIGTIDSDAVLLSGDEAGVVRSWSTADWNCISRVKLELEKVFALAIQPQSNNFVVAGRREIIHQGKLRRHRAQFFGRLEGGHREWIQTLAYAPQGDLLASGGKDALVQLWELKSNSVARTFVGHTDRVWSVAWSPDGERVVSGSEDATAKVWPARNDASPVLARTPNVLVGVALAEKRGQWVAVGSGGRITAWTLEGQVVVDKLISPAAPLISVELSRDESLAAIRTKRGSTRVFRTDTWEPLHEIPYKGELERPLAWIGDSHQLVTTINNATLVVFDADRAKVVHRIPISRDVRDLACDADGRRVVLSTEASLEVWSLQESRQLQTIPLPSCWEVALSPDGKTVWTTGGSSIYGVDMEQGAVVSHMLTVGSDADALAVSPDGRTLAVALHRPDLVSLWDTRTGQELMQLDCDTIFLHAVRFTNDGQRLAAVGESDDHRGCIWQWSVAAPSLRLNR